MGRGRQQWTGPSGEERMRMVGDNESKMTSHDTSNEGDRERHRSWATRKAQDPACEDSDDESHHEHETPVPVHQSEERRRREATLCVLRTEPPCRGAGGREASISK